MFLASKLLSSTIGRVVPKYRTLGQWAMTYRQIVDARPICDKTKSNRRSALTQVLSALGDRTLASVRPHEVAAMIQRIHSVHPQSAKRVLQEAKDFFNEAVNYGWIDRNPAAPVKSPIVRVRRQRLTFEQWRNIHDYAADNMPPWVSRMLMLALITGQRRSDLAKMRFSDIWDDHLHIEQAKTGTRLALPLSLRLDALDMNLAEVIGTCREYAKGDAWLLRKHNGGQLVLASLSARFEEARLAVVPTEADAVPPSLHECRSLSERLYRDQGINTKILLGHKHQAMTDMYNDDRGLSKGQWQVLSV